jgi:hypothetical protein
MFRLSGRSATLSAPIGPIAILALATTMALTSCSGGTPQVVPDPAAFMRPEPPTSLAQLPSLSLVAPVFQTRPSWMRARANIDAGGYTFVGQWWDTVINGYATKNPRNHGPICDVGPISQPQGMVTDQSGILYVAAAFSGDHLGVATFAANCGGAGQTFADDDGIPGDVVIDGTTLYLTNEIDTGETPATLPVYDIAKSPNPVHELSDPVVEEGLGVAVDSHHNLFWSSTNRWTGGGQVVEFRKGKMPGSVLKVTNLGSDFPGGLLIDRANDLVLIDQTADSILRYAPPYNAPASSTISLRGPSGYCAFGFNQSHIYCLDYLYGSVDVYAYPKGKYVYSYTKGISPSEGPIGIAIQSPFSSSRR